MGFVHAAADKIQMQHRLFAELSDLFGREVPMYDKSLLVNRICNRTVCALLSELFPGFALSPEELERTSGERHGAIRIGRPDEYRWMARYFAQFALEPHSFFDMANVGAKSQPIIATAFRSRSHPDHRIFCSLLLTDYFDDATRARIESLLAQRQVFSDRAKELIEKAERAGGLDWIDAEALIREGVERIFKWTGRARDHALYKDLCDSGFKIAADIACFERHHLNHLTPNTLWMDLFTAAMKRCMGEIDDAAFRIRAARALNDLVAQADHDWLRLQFKHASAEALDALPRTEVAFQRIEALTNEVADRLAQPDTDLAKHPHSGFKDFTEGPSEDTPVLLRQDAYKALKEKVTFTNDDGSTIEAVHTARFGEIEQRFYAVTRVGRALYDACLANAELAREQALESMRHLSAADRDAAALQAAYRAAFAPFPKTLPELVAQGLVHASYTPTAKGRAAKHTLASIDLQALVTEGFVRMDGLRYEDFLPVSAAGIFASNLSQYGTRTTAAKRPVYTQSRLEEIMGVSIVDAEEQYRAMEAQSILQTYAELGLLERLPAARRAELEATAGSDSQALAAAV